MRALCQVCVEEVDADYVAKAQQVDLVRRCPTHGLTSTTVSGDVEYFERCVAQAEHCEQNNRGLIIEMLDGCNMRCPTCIAASAPNLGNRRSVSTVSTYLHKLAATKPPAAIFLSGGEPTIHPDLPAFLDLVEASEIERRVLITNGVRLSVDVGYRGVLFKESRADWEVFLQFDSLRSDVLKDIRGDDLQRVRANALAFLEERQIATTLVCVVKKGLNDDELHSLIEYAKSWKCVSGIQFQPIRGAGRVENFDYATHSCDLSFVRHLLIEGGVPIVEPHPQSPLSVAVGYFNRRSGMWTTADDVQEQEYFIGRTRKPDGWLRVSIVEYSDIQSWSTLKSNTSPIDVLQADGSLLSVDDHFLAEVTRLR